MITTKQGKWLPFPFLNNFCPFNDRTVLTGFKQLPTFDLIFQRSLTPNGLDTSEGSLQMTRFSLSTIIKTVQLCQYHYVRSQWLNHGSGKKCFFSFG